MILLDYMLPPKEQTHITENYVSSPPALTIFDEAGRLFTLAMEFDNNAPRGEYAFRVLADGKLAQFKTSFEDQGPQTLSYNGDGTVNYIDVTTSDGTYRQTFTYTSGKVTGISLWVKQ